MEGGPGPRMWRIVSVGFAVVLAIAVTAGASSQRRWIVFSATPAGQNIEQLFRIHPAGDGIQQITTGTYSSIAPAFSPDGKRIAFARLGVGILVVNVDGTGLRRLTTNGRDSFPAWSPDGKHIAFVRPYKSCVDGPRHVLVRRPRERRLPKAPPSGRPSWTAGGLLIPSGGDLLKIDPTTGHVQKYYGAEIDAIWGMNTVALSPDRSTITYVGSRSADPGDKECGEGPCQRFALYKENILKKTKKPQRVVKDAGPATFSPNGKQLAFVARTAGSCSGRSPAARRRRSPPGMSTPTVSAPPAWQP